MKRFVPAMIAASISAFTTTAYAQDLKLPSEVTPALRAACEKDVRRLCIGDNPTLSSVHTCVVRRFGELSSRCKVQIAVAGLTPAAR